VSVASEGVRENRPGLGMGRQRGYMGIGWEGIGGVDKKIHV